MRSFDDTVRGRGVALLSVLWLVQSAPAAAEANPPLPGFDLGGSDARAVEIADKVMARLGGRENWDATRYLTWRFFGGRLHVWDRWTGNIRFENESLTVLMNVGTGVGRAWNGVEEITDADSLAAKLDAAYRAWINDSYWLVMPYKLKDSGVTLKFKGEGRAGGAESYILELTFADVGVTPQNKYDVYVDAEHWLVRQWSFYSNASDEEPRFTLPWSNWQRYGNIWLADDFGRSRHSEVAAPEELPNSVFVDPARLAGSLVEPN